MTMPKKKAKRTFINPPAVRRYLADRKREYRARVKAQDGETNDPGTAAPRAPAGKIPRRKTQAR
jgi:hypothetical protein